MATFLNKQDHKDKIDGLMPNQKIKKCFYCNEKLDYPVIAWISILEIWMHPECARNLCIRLIRDVWECENKLSSIYNSVKNCKKESKNLSKDSF